MKKIALLSGHAEKSEGANVCAGYFHGWGEWKLSNYYLPEIAEYLCFNGFEVERTNRVKGGGTNPSHAGKAANATGADIALEWHFNSAGQARGCEVLYWGASEQGDQFAAKLSAKIAKILDVPNRGAKAVRTPKDRGYYAFKKSVMPFFIIEPCFAGSNELEADKFCRMIKYRDWMREAARAVVESIVEVYGKE